MIFHHFKTIWPGIIRHSYSISKANTSSFIQCLEERELSPDGKMIRLRMDKFRFSIFCNIRSHFHNFALTKSLGSTHKSLNVILGLRPIEIVDRLVSV